MCFRVILITGSTILWENPSVFNVSKRSELQERDRQHTSRVWGESHVPVKGDDLLGAQDVSWSWASNKTDQAFSEPHLFHEIVSAFANMKSFRQENRQDLTEPDKVLQAPKDSGPYDLGIRNPKPQTSVPWDPISHDLGLRVLDSKPILCFMGFQRKSLLSSIFYRASVSG